MPATLAPPKREGLSNPYGLPRGEPIRKALVDVFRRQRKAILRFVETGRKDGFGVAYQADDAGGWDRLSGRIPLGIGRDVPRRPIRGIAGKDQGPPPIPFHFPDWDDFGLGALAISERMTPLLRLIWEDAADKFAPKVGLDPDEWSVVNPNTERMIEEAALAFAESTNATTTLALDEAIRKTRDELTAGVVEHGDSVEKLTDRIQAIFDSAERWRARRIAQTEASRAVHAAQEQSAIQSGVVTGWQWLASGDACPTCFAIAARCRFVRLGKPFAVIGDDPHYSAIKFPPAHPHCNCTIVEVLDTDPQPAWGDTLHDPDPATEDEHREVAERIMADYEAILAPAKRMRPAPSRRPVPLARKRLSRPVEVMA